MPCQGNTLSLSMAFQTSFGDGEEKMMTFTSGSVPITVRSMESNIMCSKCLHVCGQKWICIVILRIILTFGFKILIELQARG